MGRRAQGKTNKRLRAFHNATTSGAVNLRRLMPKSWRLFFETRKVSRLENALTNETKKPPLRGGPRRLADASPAASRPRHFPYPFPLFHADSVLTHKAHFLSFLRL